MGKIKGPIKLKKAGSISKTIRDMLPKGIRLPFEAKGFKSSKTPEGISEKMLEEGVIRGDKHE